MKISNYTAICLSLLFISCNDEINRIETGDHPTDTQTTGMYILCEGLFNMNNSTISYYDFTSGKMASFQDPDKRGNDKTSYDFFKLKNNRKLGDTANDLQRYGSKLWCAVDVSSQIEVLNLNTGMSLRQIPLFNESGLGRSPRRFAFHKNKAYICNFDGTVARIDTASLNVDAIIKVGRNPDGICVANNKLYVSNSGGLDQANPDNTVSVIDLSTFTEIKKIEVRNNLGTIQSDAVGNIYVVSRDKFNYVTNDYDCRLHRIDNRTDQMITTYDQPVLSFTISGFKAYMYSYNSNIDAVQVMDTRTGYIIDENFIKDQTPVTRIYNISVNPVNGDVYICDAQNYVINGSVHCFNEEGHHKFTIDAKGINPNSIVFTAQDMNTGTEIPGGEDRTGNVIAKVWEYVPSAGQFVNMLPTYSPGDSEKEMRDKCLDYFNKGSEVSLGGFGGYITVGFERPILNIAGEYDFKVLGNAFEGSSEPGIILISQDLNEDGLPNDEWYEIKGSEYDHPETIHEYEITYYKPENTTDPVLWSDNKGNTGQIERIFNQQSYYPSWIGESQITFTGCLLPQNALFIEKENKWFMQSFPYGYADNQPNNSDGCKFKIEWAVDKQGNTVNLPQIDFIKVYTAVNQQLNRGVGELSTEISGIEDLHPTLSPE